MLEVYTRLARRLYPFRAALWILAGVAIVAFVLAVLLFKGGHDEIFMLGAATLLLWVLFLSITIQAFSASPPPAAAGDGFLRRLGTRLVRAVQWLIATVMTVLCLGVVLVSCRVIVYLARSAGG